MPAKHDAAHRAQREPPLTDDELRRLRILVELFAPMLATGRPTISAANLDDRDVVTVTTALERFGLLDRDTFIETIRKHQLGWKAGGKWVVSLSRYRRWRDAGKPPPPD